MLKLWLPVLLCTAAAFAQRNELPERETLTYNIEWRLITAGKAHLTWRQDRDGVNIDARVESLGLVSKLFRVEDEYQARLGPAGCTETTRLTSHEGSRERETRITFDGAAHRADYLERDRVKNTVLLQHSIEIPPCVHDVIGGMYFMRTLNLEPGQSATIPVSDGKKFATAKVEAQQREDVKTPEGVFHAIRYEIYLFNNVLYRRPAHVYVWLTDDRRKLPVEIRVRMQFTIGTITLLLEKHE
jgi:hypothetical protein